jgi:dihydrofolate reductase
MDDYRRYLREEFRAAGAFLLGRVTYQIFAAYWPTVTDEEDDIAHALNSLPKYVASTTLNDTEWDGTEVIKSVVAKEVAKLKEQPGKDILVVGSSGLAQTLMRHNLVDEYRLWLHPIVLGSGKRLFREGGPTTTDRHADHA